jgi:hypothetical protein
MLLPYDPARSALYTPEKYDTLFADGVVYSPSQLAVESAHLAYYRAEESPAEMQRLGTALARAGFGGPVMFIDQVTRAAGFGSLRASDGLALLALRGTQPDNLADIAHDLEGNTVAWSESAGRVHAGFAANARSLLPRIAQWIEENRIDPKKLIITGHSLGAAMATLLASVLPAEWLVTLGSPRVGNEEFLRTLQAANIQRIVDCCDVVTELPPPLFGYMHLRTCTYITRAGKLEQDPPQSFVDADRAAARLQYLTEYSWKIGSVLIRDLADHAPINYARAFFM